MPGAGGGGPRRAGVAGGRGPPPPLAVPFRRGGPGRAPSRSAGGNFGAAARWCPRLPRWGATLARQWRLAEGLRCCPLRSSVASGGLGGGWAAGARGVGAPNGAAGRPGAAGEGLPVRWGWSLGKGGSRRVPAPIRGLNSLSRKDFTGTRSRARSWAIDRRGTLMKVMGLLWPRTAS